MTRTRRSRLVQVAWVISFLSIGIGLILYSLRSNINVYMNPSEFNQMSSDPAGNEIQLGGMVMPGSFKRIDGLHVFFDVADYDGKASVYYSGILPALFREGQGVIAIGRRIGPGKMEATQILAKHDENYKPPTKRVKIHG